MARADMTPQDLGERLNAFPVAIAAGTTLRYRIWAIDPIPGTVELREKIRSYLWQKRLHRPVVPTYVGGQFAYAVAEWGRQDPIEYTGDGDRRFCIRATDDRRLLSLDQLDTAPSAEAELAAAMLQQELRLHLGKDQRLVPGYQGGQFFQMQPAPPYQLRPRPPSGAADIYRGFNFRVIHLPGAGLSVVLDVLTSYVGRQTLAEYLRRNQRPAEIDTVGGTTRWVYDCGPTRQSVYLLRPEGRGISQAMLRDGRSVFDYLLDKYPNLNGKLTPDDPAATIMYRRYHDRDESKHYTAAATLLKPKFTTQSAEVRGLGDTPAFPSHERLRRIEGMIEHFRGARFAGMPVEFGPMIQQERSVLPLPGVQFGPPDCPSSAQPFSAGRDEREVRERWGTRKLTTLRRQGPYRQAPFVNPVFVYPASLGESELFADFLERTKAFCRDYGHVSFEPRLSSYRDAATPLEIIRKVEGLVAAPQHAGFILLALPPLPAHADRVYAGVKTRVVVPTKCFSTAKLRAQVRDGRRYASYVDRNALALLVENGTRPWGLLEPLNYELQFGFDVARLAHGGLMGASVVSGEAATDIVFGYKEIDAAERIPKNILARFVFDHLERFHGNHGRAPRGILFGRDGRLLDVERRGIAAALKKFAQGHPEESIPAWAAVAIEKTTSVPLRLFREIDRGVTNAYSGTYSLQNDRVGYLVTAGAPSLPQGTPRPLRVEIVEVSHGTDPGLLPILDDLFRLAQMNWNSPETDTRLPITLRFTDQMLERFALDVEEEEDSWDDEEEEDD